MSRDRGRSDVACWRREPRAEAGGAVRAAAARWTKFDGEAVAAAPASAPPHQAQVQARREAAGLTGIPCMA
jgi:hypothetical protein